MHRRGRWKARVPAYPHGYFTMGHGCRPLPRVVHTFSFLPPSPSVLFSTAITNVPALTDELRTLIPNLVVTVHPKGPRVCSCGRIARKFPRKFLKKFLKYPRPFSWKFPNFIIFSKGILAFAPVDRMTFYTNFAVLASLLFKLFFF